MQNTLYIEIMGSMSKKGFSLDELVIRVKELFETKAMAKIVGLLLTLADEYLCWNLVRGNKGWRPAACCNEVSYEHKDKQDRRFRTSVGLVEIRWWRLKCVKCGRWVMESDCDELVVDGKAVGIVVADGTGYKRRPDAQKDNRGALKVVLGVGSDGTVTPGDALSLIHI